VIVGMTPQGVDNIGRNGAQGVVMMLE
jgi:hypothetical protein